MKKYFFPGIMQPYFLRQLPSEEGRGFSGIHGINMLHSPLPYFSSTEWIYTRDKFEQIFPGSHQFGLVSNWMLQKPKVGLGDLFGNRERDFTAVDSCWVHKRLTELQKYLPALMSLVSNCQLIAQEVWKPGNVCGAARHGAPRGCSIDLAAHALEAAEPVSQVGHPAVTPCGTHKPYLGAWNTACSGDCNTVVKWERLVPWSLSSYPHC